MDKFDLETMAACSTAILAAYRTGTCFFHSQPTHNQFGIALNSGKKWPYMSSDTKQLIEICEQLPQAQRSEVTDFARFLLAKNQRATPQRELTKRWLTGARHCQGGSHD